VPHLLYALVGYGISNRTLCKLLKRMGYEVFVSETRILSEEEKRELCEMNVAYEENGNTERMLSAERIVVSPSVRPDHPIVSKAQEKVVTDLDVVLNFRKPAFTVAITGTNGKTTTCSMLAHVLNKLGKKVTVAGNIGNPIANVFDQQLDYLILEISSFQLFWSKSLPVDVGVILNIEPNHLDWHPSFDHYVQSKLKMFTFAEKKFIGEAYLKFVKDERNVHAIPAVHPLDKDKVIFRGRTYPLKNDHIMTYQNLQNLSAVLTVMDFLGFELNEVLRALEDFDLPPHRMQLVAVINDVRFVNDSKSTSAAATIAALGNYEDGKVILILTGRGKNESYDVLVEKIKRKAKHVLLFGEIAPLMSSLLKASGVPCSIVSNMEEAVIEAFRIASRGDVVLLSPAAASFDLYRNYEERGEHFVRVVQSLKEGI